LIAFTIVEQTSTPQWTYVTVLPLGMLFETGGRLSDVGSVAYFCAAAWASFVVVDEAAAPLDAELPLLLLVLLLLLPHPAATIAIAATRAAKVTLRRRGDFWRR
jgi:hypothetical protein